VKLILASASPRRRQLLDQLGVHYQVDPADIDESHHVGETPQEYVQRLAREKYLAIAPSHPGAVVLAADTCVIIDGEILGKPRNHLDGLAMLARLSGRKHTVLTAVGLTGPRGSDEALVATEVVFANLTREVCEAYLASDEPWDKAGAYAIQGLAGAFVETIDGSYSNVIGLPLNETWQMLAECGIPTLLDRGGD
jgi:septum formation protein